MNTAGPEVASPQDRARVYAAIMRGEGVADVDLPLARFIVNHLTWGSTRGSWRWIVLGLAYPGVGWLIYTGTVSTLRSTRPAWPAAMVLLWFGVAAGVVAATRRQVLLRRWRSRFMAPPGTGLPGLSRATGDEQSGE